MTCSECRGYRLNGECPICSEPPPEYYDAMDLFAEIRESVVGGKITHCDEIQDLIVGFSKGFSEENQDGFSDLAWTELEEFKNLGED